MIADHHHRLRRALDYPYDLPSTSFVLEAAGTRPPSPEDWRGLCHRTPVIACGSNQSVEQLQRKFGGRLHTPLPVIKAELADHDAVYSAHFARYGSLAATLCKSPGTRLALAVTFLDDPQLQHMHRTEALGTNYAFTTMKDIRLILEDGTRLQRAYSYSSLWGCLTRNRVPLPLAAIPARGRRHRAYDQRAAQGIARDFLAPGCSLTQFMLENIHDPGVRRRRTKRLSAQQATPRY